MEARTNMKMARRYGIILTAILSMLLLTAGCGGGDKAAGGATAAATSTAAEGSPKVALLTPGPINDSGWNSIAYGGLMKVKEELGTETQYSEKVGQSDMAEFIRGYAEDGFKVIIGHGFEYADPMKEIAPDYPDTWFLVTSASVSQEPNVASISINNREQGYLMGTVAALLSQSGKVAAIGGAEIPPITNSIAGFKEGAAAAKPSIEVLSAMTGSNDDIAKAKETAVSLIEKGADVVMTNGNAAGNGGIEAAKQKGVLAIGSNYDLNESAPDTVAVSVIQDYPEAIKVVVEQILKGDMKPEAKLLGVKEGAVYLSSYHGFEDKIPQEAKDKINKTVQALKDGTIKVENQ